MRVLVWHEEIEFSTKWQTAFGTQGHIVRRGRTAEEAMRSLREARFDLLIFDLTVGQESGLGVAMVAEFHQPDIVTILVSSRHADMHGDMFARLSSLRCVLGNDTPPADLVAIAEGFVKTPAATCRAVREDQPQICDSCHIRVACAQGEAVPMLQHRGVSPGAGAAAEPVPAQLSGRRAE